MQIIIWLKENIWPIVIAIVAILGSGIFWSYHRGKIRSIEVQRTLDVAHSRVSALDAMQLELKKKWIENQREIDDLESKKKKIMESAVAIENDVKKMDEIEIERAFRELY